MWHTSSQRKRKHEKHECTAPERENFNSCYNESLWVELRDHLPPLVGANTCLQRDWMQVTPACKRDFTLWDYSPGALSKLWMFFLQSVRRWLTPTWCDSRCQRTKWLPWLVKVRIGMSWCNAGRGRGPGWLMATPTERDPWSRVCLTCGWDAVPPEPGNNCGLNLDAASRMKTQPLSSVISF